MPLALNACPKSKKSSNLITLHMRDKWKPRYGLRPGYSNKTGDVIESFFGCQLIDQNKYTRFDGSESTSLLLLWGGLQVRLKHKQRTLTYFVRGSITVWLTSCLTGLDLAKQENLLMIKNKQSSWIQSNQTGGQSYSDTSPNEVSECSMVQVEETKSN